MTFSIEYSEKYVTKYWGDRPGPTKPDIEYTNSYSYSKLDYEQFKTQLKEVLDPPEDDLTVELVKKDFGHDISDECAKRIMDYYNWRKMLHAKVLDDVNRRIEEIQNSSNLEMAVEANSSSIVPFEYDIPEEYNNFSTADSNTKSGQVYAKVRVKIVL